MSSSGLHFSIKKKEFLTSLKFFLESNYSNSQSPTPSLIQTLHSLLRKGTAIFEQDIDKFLPIDYSSDSCSSSSLSQSSDQKERTLLILETIKLLLIFHFDTGDSPEKAGKVSALRNYLIKLVVTDLGKEERESLFSLIEHERPQKVDQGSLKLYNELGSYILLERAIAEGYMEAIYSCPQAFLAYCIKKLRLDDPIFRVLEEFEEKLKIWLTSADKEVQVTKQYESTLVPSFFKKKMVRAIKELDGEDIMGMYTIVNRGESYNQTHFMNILAFSYLKNWVAYRCSRPEGKFPDLRKYIVAYIMRILEQIMKVYDSLAPIPEVYAEEWSNFIEAVCCESLSILDLVFQSDSSFLIEIMDTIQKFWKRVLKKQQGFSLLYFLELALNHNKNFLLELEGPLKEFFDQHLRNNMTNETLCLQTLKFLITKRLSISLDTMIFQKYFHIPLLILITNPPLYIVYIQRLLPDITNNNNLLFIFNILVDFPLIARLHTLDGLLQEKVLLGRPLDWLRQKYLPVIPYLSLQENLQEPKKTQLELIRELYNQTPSTIKEKTLSNHLDNLLKQFFEIAEALSFPEGLLELIKLILGRYEHIFLEKDLSKKVKKRFRNFIEETLAKHPEFIIQLLDQFVEYFNHYGNEEGRDLVMHLIWLLPEIMLSSVSVKKVLHPLNTQLVTEGPKISQQEWRKTARHYCESMELVLHQLVYSLMSREEEKIERTSVEISEASKEKGIMSQERMIELVCLLLGALTKISVKYPELKHNTLLIHIKLLEKKEDLPMIINKKIVVNLKLLKDSAVTLLLLEAS